MSPTNWLRLAAGLTAFLALGHTLGAVVSGPRHGAEEAALRDAMRAFEVTEMGFTRSYWDFYMGSGITISVFVVTIVILLWQLSRLAGGAPNLARPLVGILALGFGALTVVAALYFVAPPLITLAAITICLGAAYLAAGRRTPAP